MAKKLKAKVRKKYNKKIRKAQAVALFCVLAVGFIISSLFFLRPTESETEKRELQKFPSLSFTSLFDGSFFDGINLWFSDTFPFREALISANGRLESLYGFGNRIYGIDSAPADVIPDSPNEPVTAPVDDEFIDEKLGDSITVDDPLIQDLSTLTVINDTAYELYSFNRKLADKYAYTLNSFASKVDVPVFDIIVPTSIDIIMPDNIRGRYNSSSQADAIRYIFSCLSDDVKSVNVFNILREHRTEYIYFRTDHHWTANGAYYAYLKLCEAMEIPATNLDTDFTKYTFDGFLGSFYSETGKNASLRGNPDTVYAYDPIADTSMIYYTKNNESYNWDVIRDVNGWNPSSLYSTFIGGDHPYSCITNNTVQNNKSILVVKESFGNAIVPFIVSHFSEVHVVDYRYWNGCLSDFVDSKGVDAVLFINNISATRGSSLMNKLSGITC